MRDGIGRLVAVMAGAATLAASLVMGAAPVVSAAGCSVTNPATGVRFSTLKSAVDAAAPGHTLRIAGTCTGGLTIGKRITLTGTGTAPTLRGDGSRVVTITAGPVTINGLRITNGTATSCPEAVANACGGGIATSAKLVLAGSVVKGNLVSGANASGGGIAVLTGGSLVASRSLIADNSVVADGTSGTGKGGGIAALGPVTLRRTTVDGNQASGKLAIGGGIQGSAVVSLTDSVVTDNTAQGDSQATGGGVAAAATGRITRSTLARNLARAVNPTVSNAIGGGASIGEAAVANSTISGNTAQALGLAVGGASGGGLQLGDGSVIASTIAGNTALSGGGLFMGGAVEVGTTIIAGNAGTLGRDCAEVSGSSSAGRNLIGDGTGCNDIFVNGTNGDKVGTGASPILAKLGPLADNGGLTPTRALKAGSPAIDAGGSSPCSTTTDQRGVKRPRGGRCDIGAFEK
ncbi:MAG: choice-of-anchor Q domain-containing protein [Chloroflexota bacterium]